MMPDGVKARRCKQCKRELPVELFLWGARRMAHVRVTKCFDCAAENMRQWAATSLRRFDPDKVKDAGD